MFQPGEEGYHGARFMLDDGLLDPLPDAAFALHIMPNAPHGAIGSRAGTLLASADMLEIVVDGRGGHASMPHDTRDPVPVACEIVMALQAMVTRRFEGDRGGRRDDHQDRRRHRAQRHPRQGAAARARSARCRPRRAQAVCGRDPTLAENIAPAHECDADVAVTEGFPPTVNDARAVALAEAVATSLPRGEYLDLPAPIMGAEDFSYVLEKVPGMMAFLGVAEERRRPQQCCAIHSTRMMVDETVLPRGTAFLAGCATRFLDRGWE